MTEDSPAVRKYQKAERRFRFAQGVFMALTIAGFILLNVVQFKILAGIQQTLEQQQRTTDELKTNTSQQLDRQTRYIQCLANYFGQANRAELKITDIDQCLLERDNQPVSQGSAGGPSAASAAAATQRSASAGTTQQGGSTQGNSGQSSGGTNPAPNPALQLCVLGICLP